MTDDQRLFSTLDSWKKEVMTASMLRVNAVRRWKRCEVMAMASFSWFDSEKRPQMRKFRDIASLP